MKNDVKLSAVSISNYVRISPVKVRRILEQIKHRPYLEAVMILKFMPHRCCLLLLKALNSAVCNLKSKYTVDSSIIVIQEARVNVGPTLKRFRPRAQGRAFGIKKRMSHIVR